MGLGTNWGWGSRPTKPNSAFQDRRGKGGKLDPWENHHNAKLARKHEESERKIAAWVHVVPRGKGNKGKVIKQRVKGTRQEIMDEVRNLRSSVRGDADVVIHTWIK